MWLTQTTQMVSCRAELKGKSSSNRLRVLSNMPRPLALTIQVGTDGMLGEQEWNTGPVPDKGRKAAWGRILESEQRG